MKTLRQLTSSLLVLVIVLCLAVPAFAVNTDTAPNQEPHTITVSNAKESHTYEAYQIFRGDMENLSTDDGDKMVLTNITWGTGIDVSRIDQLIADLKSDPTIGNDITNADYENLTPAEAIAYVVASFGENSEKLDAFADVVSKYLSVAKVTNDAEYNKINVTGDGYYLLKDKDDSVSGHDAYTKYILKVTSNLEVSVKAAAPTLTKSFADGKAVTSASVGQIVEYVLTSAVPEMDGYNKYYFIIHDTMAAGLTFNNDVEITLTSKDGTSVQKLTPRDYTVSVGADGQTLEIIFRDFIEYKGVYTGASIVVTYSATLDEDVNITASGNTNSAYLEFSNNPNYTYRGSDEDTDKPDDTEPTGFTPSAVTTVYSTGIRLNKVNDKTGIEQKALTGAKFSISGGVHTAYMINNVIFVKDNTNGTYYRLKDGTYTTVAPAGDTAKNYDGTDKYISVADVNQSTGEETKIVAEGWVDTEGVITFTGLGTGTYTITELIAPAGYNLLKEPIVIEIGFDGIDEDKNPIWTISKDGTTLSVDELSVENNCYSFDVANKAGATLPATGGIGTTVFYVLGAVLVLASLIILVTKKRMGMEK